MGVSAGVSAADGTAVDAPATAIGDLAQFLDVKVHQIAGAGMFVAPDDSAGSSVQPGQPRNAVA